MRLRPALTKLKCENKWTVKFTWFAKLLGKR